MTNSSASRKRLHQVNYRRKKFSVTLCSCNVPRSLYIFLVSYLFVLNGKSLAFLRRNDISKQHVPLISYPDANYLLKLSSIFPFTSFILSYFACSFGIIGFICPASCSWNKLNNHLCPFYSQPRKQTASCRMGNLIEMFSFEVETFTYSPKLLLLFVDIK